MSLGPTSRFFRLAAIAWISMLGVVGVMAGVNWNQPGFRDPDVTSAGEMALTFIGVLALPFALLSGGFLAPAAALIDWALKGRLALGGNVAIGAGLAVPAMAVFVGVGTLLFGPPNGMVAHLSAGLAVFAVGGIIVSLGMRRRD